jgi:hypothetical protein
MIGKSLVFRFKTVSLSFGVIGLNEITCNFTLDPVTGRSVTLGDGIGISSECDREPTTGVVSL